MRLKTHCLAPIPQRVRPRPGVCTWTGRLRLCCPPRLGPHGLRALLLHLPAARTAGRAAPLPIIVAAGRDRRLGPQGYRLCVEPRHITLTATAPAGVRHAAATLRQLVILHAGRIPCCDITDWPDTPRRGFMLDISRDKVPTQRELFARVDRLAALKYNQLQLYTEHTFAYRRHRAVWRRASPLTAAQIRRLDAHCRRRGIELVANQNTLGHMERWLRHPRYAPLAEATGPWRSPFGDLRTTRATLCPIDPRSRALARQLLDELLPNFSSRAIHIGCDEPFELGQGRSAAACARRGRAAVFAGYVRRLHAHLRRRGTGPVHIWADMIADHPELRRRLPRDLVLCEWGYEADHPFARRGAAHRRAGFQWLACPGTSSWCSFAGRWSNARDNIRAAARAARRAAGLLLTDWGDFGHRQHWPVSLPPIVFAAAAGWNGAALDALDLVAAASLWGFDDPTGRAASAWIALSDLCRGAGLTLRNKTILFALMQAPLTDRRAVAKLTPRWIATLRGRLAKVARQAARPPADSAAAALVQAELRATLRVLQHALRRAAIMRRGAPLRPAEARAAAAEMRRIIADHRRLWPARNRPGGLNDSVAHYERNLAEYEAIVGK
ncbi:MAG: family 20 glycosylhydrolase [Phycisphaerae bacterium]